MIHLFIFVHHPVLQSQPMQQIQVKDRQFELYLPESQLEEAIIHMAQEIQRDLSDKDPLFLAVLNGSFMFAASLMRKLGFPCRISFVKLASYSGTQSTEQVNQLIGLNEGLAGQHVVILEDIIDTGHTLSHMLDVLKEKNPASVRIATLLFKPEAFVHDYYLDYIGLKIPTAFIVGYGLDYDGYGRNLPDIYRIV